MNLAHTNTQSIKLFKQHSLAAFGGLCIAVAAVTGGVMAGTQTGGGSTSTVAPRANFTWTRTTADDWRTIYYIVPTAELGEQILLAEAEQQSVILENQGQLPPRTIRVIVADTPEQAQLVSSMMAEVSPETTSFVDLRYPPIPAINASESGPLSQAAPAVDGDFLPSQGEIASLHQPYPCSEASIDVALVAMLAGLCN